MNFINPSILFGLLAVSIPILIHLLNLRKIKKVEFSTLMFLKEIQKSKMRRIKLKQLLLLLLRVMAIVFLVLSFARPVYEGYAGSNDNRSGFTTLIFIDDSFSMAARDESGLYLSQAADAVKKILESHSESDEVYLIPASVAGFKDHKFLFDSFKELNDSLGRLKISYKPASMNDIFGYSDKILAESKNPNKEIFIISDFQKNNFNTFNELSKDEIKNRYNAVNTYLIKIGSREVNNLSLDSLVILSKIIEKDKDVKVKIFLNNHTNYNVYNKTVNIFIDNELKSGKVVDVNSFDKKEIDFSFRADHTGSVKGYIELVQSEFQDDEIIQDNKYYFSLFIPESFNIGLIADSPKDLSFISLALNTASEILSDSLKRKSGLFNVKTETGINENISGYDAVFIANKKSFTDKEAELLKDYVTGGGGIFIFPGNSIDIDNYNRTLLSKLNSVRIENLNSDTENNRNLNFERVDFENPVLAEIFSGSRSNSTSGDFNIESPKINSYYRLLPNENTGRIITLTNSYPFLIESKLSKGKVIISSVSAAEDMSDLPFKSIFVPLIIRSIYYLSNDFDFQKEYITGRSGIITVRGLNNISEFILPDKSSVNPGVNNLLPKDNYLFLPYSEISSKTGIYTLKDSTGNGFDFALNKDPSESSMMLCSDEEILDYFKKAGISNVKLIDKSESITSALNETRTGLSLWKYFLAIALLFIAGELFLSKKLENRG